MACTPLQHNNHLLVARCPRGTRALLLSLLLFVLLLATPAAAAVSDAGDSQEQQLSCEFISKVPREQQCSFIRTKCPSESLVPYAEWYFCSVAPHNVLLRTMYLAAVCCLLPLAFCLLGDTAEFYIAPIMAHVSQAIPKMRPRFAGVTFVALGNGAPDLSANIAAISAGEVTLSAGAFTGAAMFVQCVVAAELIGLAGDSGIKCGGAMLRDVGVYCLAILSVLLAFSLGQISRAFVGWAIALYVMYMIWVFAGDEWHQRGRPKPLQIDSLESFKALLSRIASRGALSEAAAAAARAGGGGGSSGGAARRSSAGGDSVAAARTANGGSSRGDDLEESLLPWVVAEDEEVTDSYITQAVGNRRSTGGGGPAQEFEGQLPSPVSPAGWSQFGAGGVGGAAGALAGLRPASFSAQATQQQQHSTEMAAGPQASFRGGARRVSAPTLQVAGGGSSGDGGAAAAASELWASTPDGVQRHASLPTNPQRQQQQQQHQYHTGRSTGHLGGGVGGGAGQPHVVSLGRQGYIDPKTYKQLVWADLADDEEEEARLERQIARQLLRGSRGAGGAAGPGGAAAGSYQPPSLAAAAGSSLAEQPQPLLSPTAASASTPRTPAGSVEAEQAGFSSGLEPAGDLLQQQQQYQQQQQQLQTLPEGGQAGGAAAGDAWLQLQWQVTLGNSEEWVDAGPVRQLFRKVTFPLLLPAYLGQRLTIPFASSSGYSREWLISSLLCFPLALVAYLGLISLTGVLSACALGIAAAVLGAVLTAWDEPGQMAVQGLGGRAAAAVPGVLAVVAFCMGVVWIDTVATEVVGIVTFLAGLAALPSGVMGLTLLAWGNSLGDFFGNRAMAKAGHTSIAITACFAAPLFNMLISLACGFSSYLHKLGAPSVRVTLTPEVGLGCLFLVGYNAAIICVGRACGWRLPPWFRHFARAWYALYFTAAVASGFHQQQRGGGGGG